MNPDVTSSSSSRFPSSGGVPDTTTNSMEDESAKRSALAGQWRTPPTPFFATGGVVLDETSTPVVATDQTNPGVVCTSEVSKVQDFINANTGSHTPSMPPHPSVAVAVGTPAVDVAAAVTAVPPPPPPLNMAVPPTLPHSAEDYAKALQEAYQRGAEAAARAAAHQMATITAKGPPVDDLAVMLAPMQQRMLAAPTPIATMTTATMTASTTTAAAPAPAPAPQPPMPLQVVHHHHHHHVPLPHPTVSAESIIGLPPPALIVATPVPLPQHNPTVTKPPTTSTGTAVPPAVASMPLSDVATATSSASAAAAAAARSVSLPDMSSYAVQQEEEKRQKRLARNRASARLRRLRKKNLVDAYESEVGSLEKTIQQLQQHEWATTNSAPALADALSMDRGQQKLTPAERCQAATDILTQQLQFLQQLEDLMQEQYVLQQMAACSLNDDTTTSESNEWKDLQDLLQLTPEQCQALVQNSAGWQDEWNALQTVKSSLQAMKENNWLWNEGCAAITDQFMSILHKNQISKFLLWTDHNAESIEDLDSVHAIDTVQDSPVFSFGVDHSPHEMLDDEKTS